MRPRPLTDVTIRTALPADVSDLQRVYSAASLSNPGDAPNLLAHPEYLVFAGDGIADGLTRLAEAGRDDARAILGFATVAVGAEGELELDDLFVDPLHQRRGVARALIADAVATATRNGYGRLFVVANHHAAEFYAAVGFVGTSRVSTALGVGARMRLEIPPTQAGPNARATRPRR